MSLTKVTWSMLTTPTDTAANIASAVAAINTTGKYDGLFIWDTTNNRMLRSSGSLAVSPWYVVSGLVTVTPA